MPLTGVDHFHGRTEHEKATPEEVVEIVAKIRATRCPECRAEGVPCVEDALDGEPAYHVGRARLAGAIARGEVPHPVKVEAIKAKRKAKPDANPTAITPGAGDPLSIVCPDCAAEPGNPCINSAGATLAHAHRQRNTAARKANRETPAKRPPIQIHDNADDEAARKALEATPAEGEDHVDAFERTRREIQEAGIARGPRPRTRGRGSNR